MSVVRACRVQFDRRELGVELVKDVDVMPIDPHDSLPSGMQPNTVHPRLPSELQIQGT